MFGLAVFQLQAQTRDTVQVSGKVVEGETQLPIASVHVFILNQEQGTISNKNGFFSIKIPVNDTLVFSSVSYETKYYVLPDSLRRGRPFIEIALDSRLVQLREVVVHGQLNPAAVRRYLDNINSKRRSENPPDLNREIPKSEPKTVPKERKHTVGLGSSMEGGAALEGVLTGLANLFNKRAQQQKRIAKLLEERKNLEAQRAYQDFLKSKFNQEIVAEATGLEGRRLQLFLDFCNFSDEFIYAATEYEMLAAIFGKLERFEKNYKRY